MVLLHRGIKCLYMDLNVLVSVTIISHCKFLNWCTDVHIHFLAMAIISLYSRSIFNVLTNQILEPIRIKVIYTLVFIKPLRIEYDNLYNNEYLSSGDYQYFKNFKIFNILSIFKINIYILEQFHSNIEQKIQSSNTNL